MSGRRDFLSSFGGLVKKNKKEEAFAPLPPFFDGSKSSVCLDCKEAKCIASCDEGIIKKEEGGVPYLDFSRRGCTFCADCASSCPSGVFSLEHDKNIKAVFEIDVSSCMAWHNTICKSCFDPCLERAIEFCGLFYPSVSPQTCIACGFCVGVCPANAIKITRELTV